MKILHIIAKEFKQNLRNWKANSMMILFPLILILILGTAFKGIFDKSIKLENVKVLYTVEGGREFAQAFKSFTGHGKDLGITFEETSDPETGRNSIRDVKYSCYVQLSEKSGEVKMYKNARYNFEANVVEPLINTFVERYNTVAAIAKTNPAALGKVMADTAADYVSVSSLDRKQQPRALDYYAVTMLTLILMYGSLTGLWSIKGEQSQKTGNRMLCSPVRNYEILVGKVLGCIFVTILQALVVISVSRFALNANWGNDIPTILLLVLSQSIMTISLGCGIAYLVKNDGAASGILNIAIPLVVFLGGGYTPIEQFSSSLVRLSDLSPVRWINKAIFNVIYDGNYTAVPTAVLINLAVAAAFITLSAVLARKEAV